MNAATMSAEPMKMAMKTDLNATIIAPEILIGRAVPPWYSIADRTDLPTTAWEASAGQRRLNILERSSFERVDQAAPGSCEPFAEKATIAIPRPRRESS